MGCPNPSFSGGRRDGQVAAGAPRPTKESLLDHTRLLCSSAARPSEAPAHPHRRTSPRTRDSRCRNRYKGLHPPRGRISVQTSAQKGPDFSPLTLSDPFCSRLCKSPLTPIPVPRVSAAPFDLAVLIKYKNIKLHNCKVSLAIPRSTWCLGT